MVQSSLRRNQRRPLPLRGQRRRPLATRNLLLEGADPAKFGEYHCSLRSWWQQNGFRVVSEGPRIGSATAANGDGFKMDLATNHNREAFSGSVCPVSSRARPVTPTWRRSQRGARRRPIARSEGTRLGRPQPRRLRGTSDCETAAMRPTRRRTPACAERMAQEGAAPTTLARARTRVSAALRTRQAAPQRNPARLSPRASTVGARPLTVCHPDGTPRRPNG